MMYWKLPAHQHVVSLISEKFADDKLDFIEKLKQCYSN